jgi:hypothetical protein
MIVVMCVTVWDSKDENPATSGENLKANPADGKAIDKSQAEQGANGGVSLPAFTQGTHGPHKRSGILTVIDQAPNSGKNIVKGP